MQGEAEIKKLGDLALEMAKIRELVELGAVVSLSWTTERDETRTDQQRKAIEVFCREVAIQLNDRGLDKRAVFEKMRAGVEIPWTQDGVKDDLWRQIQIVLLGKESTAKLAPAEVSRVYDVVNRFLVDRFSFSVPFPSRFG